MQPTASPPQHQRVLDLLRNAAYPEVRQLSCEFQERKVVLQGRVSSYYLKQVAQNLILDGLRNSIEVENQLAVARQDDIELKGSSEKPRAPR